MSKTKADPMQCWRLVAIEGAPPEGTHYKVGAIARFSNGIPGEALWNQETGDFAILRWAKCDDPRKAGA